MANNYEQILALANKNNMGLSNTIKRDYGIPLDYSSVQETYEAALEYAKTSTLAYIGQPISVGDTLYIITDEANDYLKAVGTKPSGDDASIEVAEDGTISLKGFEAAEDARLPQIKVTRDAEGNETGREIEWVAIDAIVQGDGNDNTKTVVTAGTGITVTPNYNEDTDTYTYTLDVALPAVPEYTVVKTDGTGYTTYQLTKDGTKVGDDIVVPDAYDDSTISADLSALQSRVEGTNGYVSRIAKIEAFFEGAAADEGEGESLKNALDTLKEIQDYITVDGDAAAQVLANKTAIETLNGADTVEGSVAKAVKDAVDVITGDLPDGTTATLASLNSAISTNAGAIAANASDIADLNEIVFINDEDFASSDQFPIVPGGTVKDLAKENHQTLLYHYSIFAKNDIVNGDIESIRKSINEKDTESKARDTALEGLIATNTSNIATLNGDASTAGSVAKTVADAIAPLTNEATGIYATAVAAAATDAQNKVNALAEGQVKTNTADISAINASITGENGINKNISEHNTKIGALEEADKGLSSRIDALNGSYETLSNTANGHTPLIEALQRKDEEHSAAISANTEAFKNYSTTTKVQEMIKAAVGGIDNSAINTAINENKDAIATEKTRAKGEEARIENLTKANKKAAEDNAAAISALETTLNAAIENDDTGALDSIKELATWVSEHDTDVLPIVNANTTAIETLNGDASTEGSVAKTVADAIANIPAIEIATDQKAGIVKASNEIAVAADGAMGIVELSAGKLNWTGVTLILDGGTAEVATEQPEEE